eukprot:827659_1
MQPNYVTGNCTRWVSGRGYGFVRVSYQGGMVDVFVHSNQIQGGVGSLDEGCAVQLEIDRQLDGRYRGRNVRIIALNQTQSTATVPVGSEGCVSGWQFETDTGDWLDMDEHIAQKLTDTNFTNNLNTIYYNIGQWAYKYVSIDATHGVQYNLSTTKPRRVVAIVKSMPRDDQKEGEDGDYKAD